MLDADWRSGGAGEGAGLEPARRRAREQARDGGSKVIHFEGLVDEHRGEPLRLAASLFVAERGHQDDRRSKVGFAQGREYLQARADGHADVGHDEVHGPGALPCLHAGGDLDQQPTAVDQLDHLVAVAPKGVGDDATHLAIVLRDENATRADRVTPTGHRRCYCRTRARPARSPGMTIAGKFTLALLSCVVVAVTANAVVAVREELARTETDIVEYEESTAHALRPAIRDVWRHDGEGRALELIQEAKERLRNVDVRWVSLGGDAPLETRPRVPVSKLAALRDGQDVVVVDRDYEGRGSIFTYVPVRVPAPFPVALEVSRSLANHAAVRRAVVRSAAVTGLLVAAATGIVTSLLGLVLVGRPLAELVSQARRVGEGDLTYRIAAPRGDEVAVLAREMNRMCDRLRDSRENERAQADAKTRALAQLRHADRLATVGRLAAGLAHELGTPLNVVLARAKQMVGGGSLVPSEVADRARIIVEQVDRMTKLIRQLLDFARKRELEPTDVDLRVLVTRATTLLDPIARKGGLSLVVTGDSQKVMVRVDVEQMTQVLMNLVMNAVHASPSGGVVSIGLDRARAVPPAEDGRGEQPCARIEVRDEGTGVPPDALPHIFEPFFTTKDIGEGTGLGLSVAYGIVKDHGGWIDVVSRPGDGSVFTVWLPEGGRA